MCFQQYGATAHAANESMTIVRNVFPGQLISRFGKVPLPPRSPDHPTCDFFLGGGRYFKCVLTLTNPVRWMKEAIRQEIRPIDRQLLAHVMDDF